VPNADILQSERAFLREFQDTLAMAFDDQGLIISELAFSCVP
jgi:hypothetical protein